MLVRIMIVLLTLVLSVFKGAIQSCAQEEVDGVRRDLLQGEWERNPSDLKVALLLGQMLRREGRTEEAKSMVVKSMGAVKKQIESEGDSAERHYLLSMGALFLNRNYTALDGFQLALSMEPEREEIHLGLVRTLFNLKKYVEAEEALLLASALFPDSESVKRQLAEVYEQTGSFAKAIPIFEELNVLSPQDKGVFKRLLGSYVKSGETEKAKPLFQQLVDEGILSQVEASVQLFRIHLLKGDLRSARIELQSAVEADANHVMVKDAFRDYYVAQANLAEEGENYRRAILFWERALEQVPGDSQSQYRLGLAHAVLKNYEEAIDYYLPLMEHRPTDPFFYADLSDALLALERVEATNRVVQLGIKLALESNNKVAMERLQEIEARATQVSRQAQ